MSDCYYYEYAWDSSYCYPKSFVLKNKLGLIDGKELAEAERELTALNLAEIKRKPVRGKFDLKHLQAIHKAIFRDVFTWAGKLRTVDIAKGNQFCLCQHLETYAATIFDKLKAENYLLDTPATQLPARLAYYLSEINVLHPFREGNGRAQRVFIEQLAQKAGYHVDFSDVSSQEMIEASALSFAKEYDKMIAMFERILASLDP